MERKVREWLPQNEKGVPLAFRLGLSYNLTVFLFVNGYFREANQWLIGILNMPGREERKDIRDSARILQLILQYEMGNLDLQEYLLRSAYRYFQKNEGLAAFEKMQVRAFKKLAGVPPGSDPWRSALSELKSGLDDLRNKIKGRPPLGMEEVSIWVESKLSGKEIAAIFAEMRI